jgi:hypothetical protein
MKDDNTPIDESQLDERFAVEGAVPQEDLNSPSDIIDRNKPSAISFFAPGERDIVDQTNSHIRFFIHQRDGRKHPVSIWWHKGNDKGYIKEKEPYLDYTYHDVYFNIPFKGAGGYEAIWWHSWGGQSLSSFRGFYVSDRPVIDSVQVFNNIITGGGGELSTLKIRTSGGAHDITYDFTSNGGKWSAPVLSSVHPAHYDVVVEQRVQGYTTRYSVEERILYLAAPKFALTNDQTVKLDTTVQIAGTWGAPGQQIQVANENGGVKYGETNALSNGDWGIILAAKENFPNGGRVVLNARHTLSGNEAWARLSLFLLAPPTIDAIPAEVEINVQIKGAGHSDISGNSVDVFLDPSSVQIGSGRVQSGRWFADLKLEPGRRTITAAQLYTSITSERAAPRVFKVRPPTPELKSRQVEGRTELHGTGYTGAKVDVHAPNDGTPFLWAEVISGLWSVAIPDTILPGNKKYLCRQSVSDGQGGSIFSTGWTDEITVNVPTPKPMVRTPTVSGQQVTFSGTGNRWDNATVQVVIFRNGIVLDAVPKANVLPTLQWTTSAVLPPGIYDNLTTTQWVNGQHSAAIAVASVVIVPLAPGVNPIEDNSFSPRFSGTCWQGATISLLFSDSDQPGTHMDTDKDGKWTFTRGAPFVPGDHTVRINQTFGGQTSASTTPIAFNIPTPEVAIKYPLPGNEASLQPSVIVTNAYIGSVIRVYDAQIAGKVLGQHTVTQAGECSILLTEEFASESEQIIRVDQDYNGQKSKPSADVKFTVRLSKPLIGVPQATKSIERFADYSGIGWPNSKVFLTRVGFPDWVREVEVDVLGEWKLRVQVDEVGPQTLAINQRYGTFTRAGDDQDFNVIPNAPVFETPAENERLTSQRMFTGFGYPGDTVSVFRHAFPGYDYGTVKVSEKGTWSIRSQYNIPIGQNLKVTLKQERDEYRSGWTPPRIVHLPSPESWIYEPAPGDWVGIYPWVCGRDTPGAQMTVASVFDSQQALAPITTADEYGRWRVQLDKPLPVGPNWVQVRASRPQPDGQADVVSDWVYSGRFIVEQMGTEFVPPTVKLPPRRSEVGLRPVLKGSGLSGAKIQITVANVIRAEAWVDRKGCWTARFKDEVPVVDGLTSYSIRQSRDGVWSRQLAPERSFKVTQVPDGFQAPVIDGPEPGDVVDSRFWLYGSAIPGAQVDVCQDLDVYATIEADAEGQWQVCINRVLAAGDFTFTARQTLDGKESQSTSAITVNVNELLPPPVQDPSEGTSVTPVTKVSGRGYPGATVTLLRSGSPYISWGAGEVDGFGYWEILTKPLPLGTFKMTGKQTLSDKPQSAWMVERIYYVSNAG